LPSLPTLKPLPEIQLQAINTPITASTKGKSTERPTHKIAVIQGSELLKKAEHLIPLKTHQGLWAIFNKDETQGTKALHQFEDD
jgi:hypothetical protein